MLRGFIVIPSSQEEWMPWIVSVEDAFSPWSSLCAPAKWPHHIQAAQAQPQEEGESRNTRAQHMFGMNHLILYITPFPVSHQEKSINARKVYSKQTSRLWEPYRSGFTWGALSASLEAAPEAPNPPSTWCLLVPVSSAKMKFLGEQRKEIWDQGARGILAYLLRFYLFPPITIRYFTSLSWYLMCLDRHFFLELHLRNSQTSIHI